MKSTFWESLRIDVLWFVLMDVSAEAYDALDPTGNITIKWDVISWTPDGYVVSINELQFSFLCYIGAFIRYFGSTICD